MKSKKNYPYIVGFFLITILFILIYLIVRISLFLITDYMWCEKIVALLLLFAETFILIHSIGYFSNIWLVYRSEQATHVASEDLSDPPPIAIVVASYKEPLSILRDTLTCFYNISYPNKHLYFLDDTRYEQPWDTPENKEAYKHAIEDLCRWFGVNLFRSKWHGAKAGKINDFLHHISGNSQPGFELQWNEKKEKEEKEKYLIIFDADMNPIPNFAEELVLMMEKKPKAAFIQTPQYYTNFSTNRMAHAAGIQQAIFYEFICEGKGLKDAMFCCGTNVLFRIEALTEVDGFDETSVTEDFATSVKLHGKGWGSIYVNKVLAFGMGPEDLGGYLKQQFRWATGTIGILRTLPVLFFRNFRRFTLAQWWEYFLASTHYLVGWVLFIMIVCPILFLVFNVPRYLAYPEIYMLAYIPYIVISGLMFFWTLGERQYHPKDLLPALFINTMAFPVFMKASFYALLGVKVEFGITPKGEAKTLSLCSLIPQLLACLACAFAFFWGLQRLYYERDVMMYAVGVNMFWVAYNFITISSFIYFNSGEKTKDAQEHV